MSRDLDISEIKGAKANIKDLKTFGDGDTFKLLCKASSEEQGFMKSTKVCNCAGGCIVQTSTMQRNEDGTYAVAEALVWVPGNKINTEVDPRRIEAISLEEYQSNMQAIKENYKAYKEV